MNPRDPTKCEKCGEVHPTATLERIDEWYEWCWVVKCEALQVSGNTETVMKHLGFWLQEALCLRRQVAILKARLSRYEGANS